MFSSLFKLRPSNFIPFSQTLLSKSNRFQGLSFLKKSYFCTIPPVQNKKIDPESDILLNKYKDVKSKEGSTKEGGEEEMGLTYKLALASIGVAALYILYKLNDMQSKLKKIDDVRVSHKGQAAVGENWELIDTDGNEISPKTLAGSYYLVYFGFCHCPDICPANLIKIKNAVNLIKSQPENLKYKLKVLFISVDPERDSLQAIRQFIDVYDTTFLGATGANEEKMKEALKSFKVVANKILYDPDDEELKSLKEKFKGDTSKFYTMDHTTNTFLMDPKGRFLDFYDGNRPEQELSAGILKSIIKREKQEAVLRNSK